jgi:shikimate kinase
MATGKSTIGKQLAKALQYQFVDLDTYIEEKEKKTIPTIFDQYGETTFRLLEQQYLQKTFTLKNTVIACGGGTPCFFDNMQQMNTYGKTVWLQTEKNTLVLRLQNAPNKRPLVANLSPAALDKKVTAQLLQREPFYQQSQYIFITEKDNIIDFISTFAK